MSLHDGASQESHAALATEFLSDLQAPEAKGESPLTRVVELLREMSATLKEDMEEQQKLHDKLDCWCEDNRKSKEKAIKANTAKIEQLVSSIEEYTATSASLKEKIKNLDEEVVENRKSLGEATAVRTKENEQFATLEKEMHEWIHDLKHAISVMTKHKGSKFPQLSAVSFLQLGSGDDSWGLESKDQRDLDMFMGQSGLDDSSDVTASDIAAATSRASSAGRFLQHSDSSKALQSDGWSADEMAVLRKAMQSAKSFMQRKKQASDDLLGDKTAGDGAILGLLQQILTELSKDLEEAQNDEASAAKTYGELRIAKTAEIVGGEKSSEQKEDEKAKTDIDLAGMEEDKRETQVTLAEDEKYLKNLKKTCAEADASFEVRKKTNLDEMKAFSEAIEILSDEDAKDASRRVFSSKSSFLQISSSSRSHVGLRRRAARVLRRVAATSGAAELAALASSTELDSFTKVKEAIAKMVATLNQQQADEVKKQDYCKKELQSNDMATMKAKDLEGNLEANVAALGATIKSLDEDIKAAKLAISAERVSLQEATINRKKENQEFQKALADQTLTIKVLEKGLDRLARYYDEEGFIQISASGVRAKQTPPVAVPKGKETKVGGEGAMSLIEKLIYDAREIMTESKHNEQEAQISYEEMVEDTNGTIKALSKSVTSKADTRVETHRDMTQKSIDLKATKKDIVKLAKYDEDLHKDCDYILRNFDVRQKARGEEIMALKQATSILDGAYAS